MKNLLEIFIVIYTSYTRWKSARKRLQDLFYGKKYWRNIKNIIYKTQIYNYKLYYFLCGTLFNINVSIECYVYKVIWNK